MDQNTRIITLMQMGWTGRQIAAVLDLAETDVLDHIKDPSIALDLAENPAEYDLTTAGILAAGYTSTYLVATKGAHLVQFTGEIITPNVDPSVGDLVLTLPLDWEPKHLQHIPIFKPSGAAWAVLTVDTDRTVKWAAGIKGTYLITGEGYVDPWRSH